MKEAWPPESRFSDLRTKNGANEDPSETNPNHHQHPILLISY